MGVKGQVELGQGSRWSRILGGKVSWRLAPESGTCRQCSSQLSLAQTSRVGWGPCLLCPPFSLLLEAPGVFPQAQAQFPLGCAPPTGNTSALFSLMFTLLLGRL